MKINIKVNAIIDAAIVELQENGVGGANMENIAKLAGVSKANLYKYFPSKTDIRDEIITKFHSKMNGLVHFEYQVETPPGDQLKRFILQKLAIFMEDRSIRIIKMIIGENSRKEVTLQLSYDQVRDKLISNIVRWIEIAQGIGVIDKSIDPLKAATYYRRLHQSYVFMPIVMEGKGPFTRAEVEEIAQEIYHYFSKELGV